MTDPAIGQYEIFFQRSGTMFCVADADWSIRECNPAWRRELGLTAAEVSGKKIFDFIPPEDRAAALSQHKKILDGEEQALLEARFLCKDGTCKWLSSRWTYDREKMLLYGAATDITARKMITEALRESETSLRKILDRAPMAMAIVSMDGTIDYINRKAVETFGYRHTDIPNMDRWWVQAYPNETYRKEVLGRWMGHVQEAFIKNSEIDGGEYRVTCKDGTVKTCFIFGVIAAGKVFVMFDDITRRTDAEKALRESESLYRALIETTATGYVVIDGQGKVVDANRKYVRLSGHSDLKQLIGRSVTEWTAPHEIEKNKDAIAQCARDGHIWNLEIDYTAKSGKTTPVEINATVVSRGGVPQILTLCRDISNRRQRQEEIRSLNEGLEKRVAERTAELTAANLQLVRENAQRLEAEKAGEHMRQELMQAQKMEVVGRLAGGIAHDFNNILGAISGHAEFLLKSAGEGAPFKDDLSEIILETEAGAMLTRQLTAISRHEPAQYKILNINEVVDKTCRMLTRLIGVNMRLETALTPAICSIKADPGQISQVIMNLVVNARDAMPEGGRITITTSAAGIDKRSAGFPLPPGPGRYAALSVSDTGCGIAAETLPHVFEPFFTTKEEGKGTGLGLSTVYNIVSKAAGGIEVLSEPGKGTTFRIYFPCMPQ